MTRNGRGTPPPAERLEDSLAGLMAPTSVDFSLRVLQRVGIPKEVYDTYVHLDTPSGAIYVAFTPEAVTGSALASMTESPEAFEEMHHARTGRSAIRTTKSFPGLRPALRSGRTRHLPIDLSCAPPRQQAVLHAVRTIPRSQLRPLSWVAREAAMGRDVTAVERALLENPLPVLIPCHRVTYEDGAPCETATSEVAGDALRQAEGIDMRRVEDLSRAGGVYLASDTTRIYCHQTCAHARRITPPHQVLFRSAEDAREAGYRACKSCRPMVS